MQIARRAKSSACHFSTWTAPPMVVGSYIVVISMHWLPIWWAAIVCCCLPCICSGPWSDLVPAEWPLFDRCFLGLWAWEMTWWKTLNENPCHWFLSASSSCDFFPLVLWSCWAAQHKENVAHSLWKFSGDALVRPLDHIDSKNIMWPWWPPNKLIHWFSYHAYMKSISATIASYLEL